MRSPKVIKSNNDLVQSNRRVIVDDYGCILSLSVGTASYNIVHDDLGYSKSAAGGCQRCPVKKRQIINAGVISRKKPSCIMTTQDLI